MSKMSPPFSLPPKLTDDLAHVHDYWADLKRGENKVPFADDANLSALAGAKERALLIDVFEMPQRFRLNSLGAEITKAYGSNAVGKFVDEIEASGPMHFLSAQASATVELCEPTYYQNGIKRLLLPLWGEGHIALLLGAIGKA